MALNTSRESLTAVPWRDFARTLLGSSIVLGLVLAVLSWPYDRAALTPSYGFDPSWAAALEMAAHGRLAFGTHVVFAYGPLGFLAVWPVYYAITAVFSFLFLLALYTTVFAVLIWSLRQAVPLAAAFILAFVTGCISINIVAFRYTGEPEKSLALAAVGCIYALTRPPGMQVRQSLWIAFGIGLGIFGLLKPSLGVGIAVALLITVLCLSEGRLRAVGLVVLGAVPTLAIAWFATGNGFGNIAAFVRGVSAIIGGYGAAVAADAPSRWYTYWLALAVIVIVAGFAVARSWSLPRRAQIGVGLVTLVLTWQLFKEGFVRHDLTHDPVFFAAIPLMLAAFVPPRRTQIWGAALAGAVLATALIAGAVSTFPVQLTRPGSGAPDFAKEVATLALSGRRSARIEDARRGLQSDYRIPVSFLHRVQGNSIDVEPWAQSVVWAYPGTVFDPLPGLQAYSTYTTSLDRLDVDYLASSDAPKYILNQPQSAAAIDGRDPSFEPPATQVAIECRYRQVMSDQSWQLLERARSRCGTTRLLGKASTGLGEFVRVPSAPPGDAVVATMELPLSLSWNLKDFFFKPPIVHMLVNGGANSYRFVPGTAASLHLLVPAPSLDYSPEFTPQTVKELAFTIDGQSASSGVTIRFYALPMSSFTATTSRH